MFCKGELIVYGNTGVCRVEDVAPAKVAGMNAHIAKPIDVTALYRTLEAILNPPAQK